MTSKEQEIREGNRLIRIFDGWKIDGYGKPYKDGKVFSEEAKLRFHADWNLLMPVVEKIEAIEDFKIPIIVTMNRKSCNIINFYPDNKELLREISAPAFKVIKHGKTKIEATWLAVIAFITWFNSLKAESK